MSARPSKGLVPDKTLKLLSWNVNGLRAVFRKGFVDWLRRERPDVACVQETKAFPGQLPKALREIDGYHGYWTSPDRKGYSGVAIYTRRPPLSVSEGFGVERFDAEGRTLIAEYPGFTLFNVYFPNARRNLERLDYKLAFYEALLQHCEALSRQGRRIVLCGDFNIAHTAMDLARAKENAGASGFLPGERAWIDRILRSGYVDTFRHVSQEPGRYTYWDTVTRARERNVGWRIDYFFVSEALLPMVKSAWIDSHVLGSDHCPIGLELIMSDAMEDSLRGKTFRYRRSLTRPDSRRDASE